MRLTASQTYPTTTLGLIRFILSKIPERLLQALPLTLVFGLLGWLLHTFLLVFANEGFKPDTWLGRNVLNVQGRLISSTLLWLMLGAMVPLIINFFRHGGKTSRRLTDIVHLPQKIAARNKATNGRILPTMILVCAVSLFIESWLLSGLTAFVAGMIAVSSVLNFTTGRGSLLIQMLRMIFHDIRNFILHKPGLGLDEDTIFMTVGGTGILMMIIGLVKALIPTNAGIFFLVIYYLVSFLWVLFLIAAIVLLVTRKQLPAQILFIVSLGATLLMASDLALVQVLADDGGWREAGGTLIGWITSEGAIPAVLSGLPPSLAGLVGFYSSSILSSLFGGFTFVDPTTPPGSPVTGTTPPDQAGVNPPSQTGTIPQSQTGSTPPLQPGAGPGIAGGTQQPGQPLNPQEQQRLQHEQAAREFEQRRQAELARQQEARRKAQDELRKIQEQKQQHEKYIQKLCAKYKTTPENLRTEIARQMGRNELEGKFWTKCIEYEKELAIAETTAKVILIGCDTAIDGLANCTGAVGKAIRAGYKVTKGIAGNMAEKGLSKEALAGGFIKGSADALTDLTENSKTKFVTSFVGETVGEAMTEGVTGEGIVKGAINAGINVGLDKLAGKGYGNEVMGGPGRKYGMEMGDLSGLTRWRPGQGAPIEKDVSRLVAGKFVRQLKSSGIKGAGTLTTEFGVKPAIGME